MDRFSTHGGLLLAALLLSACGGGSSNPEPEEELNPQLSGGATTVFDTRSDAFSLPAANLSSSKRGDFQAGNSFFRNPWIIAPSTTDARDGLGPLFNVSSCQSCHIRDGRGHPPAPDDNTADSMLVRLAVPPQTQDEADRIAQGLQANAPEPTYGGQLQDRSNPNVEREARVHLTYALENVTLADGTVVELRRPNLALESLAYGEMHAQTAMSARIAPPMIGLGLLEAVPEATVLAKADPDDADHNGISGRPNWVFDLQSGTPAVLGRFGWKALTPNVRTQTVAAFNGDIGITSTQLPEQPCTSVEVDCLAQPDGGTPELTDEVQELVLFYSQHLAVPARRDIDDAQVIAGDTVFNEAGCASCHTPHLKTGELADRPELSNQDIFPYTDLLLHDMGPDLADGVPEFAASGAEWRTAPLWGIGLTATVADDQPFGFLHDGRARTLLEAVLWHGGEAQAARDAVVQMSAEDRDALIRFLESL